MQNKVINRNADTKCLSCISKPVRSNRFPETFGAFPHNKIGPFFALNGAAIDAFACLPAIQRKKSFDFWQSRFGNRSILDSIERLRIRYSDIKSQHFLNGDESNPAIYPIANMDSQCFIQKSSLKEKNKEEKKEEILEEEKKMPAELNTDVPDINHEIDDLDHPPVILLNDDDDDAEFELVVRENRGLSLSGHDVDYTGRILSDDEWEDI